MNPTIIQSKSSKVITRALRTLIAACAVSTCCVAASVIAAEPLERLMNVKKGPESVFDRPARQVLPALEDAKATSLNGRIGNELVFWGYELADGRRVDFFACALLPDVDCAERVQAICVAPTPTTVLESRETTGKVIQRTCRNIAQAAPGDLRPGCADNEEQLALLVGLVQCG
jgi:hypothetical protein